MNITDEIIEILKPIFLKNIRDNVNLISKEFSKYITEKYEYFNKKNMENDKREKMIKILIDNEINVWGKCNEIAKKRIVIHDENMENIYFLSSKSFGYARRKLNENVLLPENEAENIINELNKCYNLVLEHNKELAQRELSESSLDLNYAMGKNENITSLRIGREIKSMKTM